MFEPEDSVSNCRCFEKRKDGEQRVNSQRPSDGSKRKAMFPDKLKRTAKNMSLRHCVFLLSVQRCRRGWNRTETLHTAPCRTRPHDSLALHNPSATITKICEIGGTNDLSGFFFLLGGVSCKGEALRFSTGYFLPQRLIGANEPGEKL